MQVTLEERRPLPEPRPAAPPPPFRPPPRPRETTDTSFLVRFVDETGLAIGGLDVEIDAGDDVTPVTTNPAGVALLEHAVATSATVTVPDPASLEEILDRRWEEFRTPKPQKKPNTVEVEFDGGDVPAVKLKPVAEHTVVIKPPLGKLFVELWDRAGRVRHAERDYAISGPMSFAGKTDDQGRLSHPDVFPGDYTLSFAVRSFEGKDEQVDPYDAALIVLSPSEGEPQVRMIGAVPRVVLARLRLLFNTNKAFLLPTAFPSIASLRKLYIANNPSQLLVVGHADTSGPSDFNDQLALDRANATIAFLKDDVDGWLAFFDGGVPAKKRWGAPEDRMMLVALPDFETKPKSEDAVRWFQRTRGLTVDGKAGPATRRQLVTEYMALDGVSLEDLGLEIDATAHGCGENFPLDDSGDELDAAPADDKKDPMDRRVELFFFDAEFGILPAPPGKTSAAGSPEYSKWRARAAEVHDFAASAADSSKVTFVEMADALFRTNSAVVLPEGEAPSSDGEKQEALTSVGALATALRFNEEHAGKKILVAGHTDTEASTDFNQTLSNERAKVGLALLMGDRESFKTVCDGRHKVSDYKQILAWVPRAFEDLTFDCDPGKIDDEDASGVEPVRRFQKAYNTNKTDLGATGPDLATDGSVGPLTWGAFFDCYELALQQELGEDAAGVNALRTKAVFVDDKRKSLGFSEFFPVEELGVDNFKSQANRRVEILFFDAGEEPDTEHAEADPETSEIYLPGHFARTPIPVLATAKRGRLVLVLTVGTRFPDMEGDVVVSSGAELIRVPVTDLLEPEPGIRVLELDPEQLPGIVEIRRDREGVQQTVVGPCSLGELSGALLSDRPEIAGNTGFSSDTAVA